MMGAVWVQLAASLAGSFCFGILFNLRGMRLAASAAGGLLSWGLFLLLDCWIASEPFNYFVVAFVISLYAEVMARLLRTPATPIVTTSLIPLIPGGSLYYTMAYAFGSDFEQFLAKAVSTLQLASALALGILAVTALSRFVFRKGRNAAAPSCCCPEKDLTSRGK